MRLEETSGGLVRLGETGFDWESLGKLGCGFVWSGKAGEIE